MSKEMEFGGWHDVDETHRAWTLPKSGFGRVQKKEDAVLGKDGKMLFVLQNMIDKDEPVEKIDELLWTEEANQRFLEVYGPNALDSHRFLSWLSKTHSPQTVETYKRMVLNKA